MEDDSFKLINLNKFGIKELSLYIYRKLNIMVKWIKLTGYDGMYDASSDGQVFSHYSNKVLKGRKTNRGYLRVALYVNGNVKHFLVHRLIYEAFNGPIPDGYELDHCDGDKTNNKLENLKCVTHIDNMRNTVTRPKHIDAMKKLAQSPEWKKNHAKTHNKPVLQIDKVTGDVIKIWESIADVERKTDIHRENISACCRGINKSAGGYIWRYAS